MSFPPVRASEGRHRPSPPPAQPQPQPHLLTLQPKPTLTTTMTPIMTPGDSVQLGKSLPSHAPPTYHAPFFLDVFFFYTRGFDSPPGVSGFGRIGRMTLRAFQEMQRNDMEVVLINSPGPVETSAHLYEFDSVHGRVANGVNYGDDWLDIGTGRIYMSRERDPANIPHAKHGVDIVLECSGKFNNRDASAAHLAAGAKKVLVSAPCKNADITVVYGVNHKKITKDHKIISNGSCTTNCLAPLVYLIDKDIGINSGYMTTVHAYTGDQSLQDTLHSDLRRARAASYSMIPTGTGAAKAVGLVLPELNGKLDGTAIRVPTANVSIVDLKFTSKRPLIS